MKLMKKGFVCVPGGWRGLGVVEGGGRGGGEAGVLTRPMFTRQALTRLKELHVNFTRSKASLGSWTKNLIFFLIYAKKYGAWSTTLVRTGLDYASAPVFVALSTVRI